VPKPEDFQNEQTSVVKELTRKLYWSIASTVALSKEQKATTFSWAASYAERVAQRVSAAPPPAFRTSIKPSGPTSPGKKRALAIRSKNRYAAQAGGGAAGFNGGPDGPTSSTARPAAASFPGYRDFLDLQKRQRARAVLYMADMARGGTCKH